jgi:hypothetical protein
VNLKPKEIPSGRIKRLNIHGAGDRPEYRIVAKPIKLCWLAENTVLAPSATLAHEVLSKTPRMQVFPLLSSVLPKAFPVKASDLSLMWFL